MTIAYFCIVIAIFIPIGCAAFSKFTGKGYNNHTTRESVEKMEGAPRRANFAQMNSWEALTPFAAGVIVAHQLHAPQDLLNNLAVAFIICRLLYIYAYITDRATLRSVLWFAAFGISISLFFIGKG